MSTPAKQVWFNKHSLYHICCPAGCLVFVGLNSAILDYYLIRYNSTEPWHYMWIIADILVLCLFLTAFIKSYKYFKQDKLATPDPTGCQIWFGNLPFSYISWLIFSVFMSAKVFFIYALPNSIVSQVERCNFTTNECFVFGKNTLSAGISMAAVVFKLLVFSHIDVEESTADNDFTQSMVGIAYLDILDTTQFLDALSDECNALVSATVNATLNATAVNARVYKDVYDIAQWITCVNYVLPTGVLFALAWSRSGFSSKDKKFKFIHSVVYYFFVNVPILSIRIIIWSLQNMEISVFFMKNIIRIAETLKTILGYCFDDSSCAHKENSPSSTTIARSPNTEMKETTLLVMEPMQYVGEINVNYSQM